MDVKAGDEMYLYKWAYIGFSEMYYWEKVVIARTTKTLIFAKNIKFRKSDIGIHLFEINDETTRKATKDNNFFKHKELQIKFRIINGKTLA